MKIVEEKYLKSAILKLNNFVKDHRDFLDFFNDVETFLKQPLQEQSFKGDLKFFDEVSLILSVITSIISKPHIASKGEEVILRSELAPHLSNEMFQKTLRDSTLWTEEGLDMIPQYVYYYQHIDELRIYENIFIVYLIKLIDLELNKYNDFYASMIHIIGSNNSLSLTDDYQSLAFSKIKLLNRKMKHIKATYFFKTINKQSTNLGPIHPTNILVKDRLYNLCFKFYKKMITYVDETEKANDFRTYYYTNILKALKKLGFKLKDKESVSVFFNNSFVLTELNFVSKDFEINVIPNDEYHGFEFEIINLNYKDLKTKHLLLFDTKTKIEELELPLTENYDSVEIASLWNIAIAEGNDYILRFDEHITEEDLVKEYFSSKIVATTCSTELYSHYCPSCKSNDLDINENIVLCECCNSKYAFYTKKNQDYLWFIRLRNKKTNEM